MQSGLGLKLIETIQLCNLYKKKKKKTNVCNYSMEIT